MIPIEITLVDNMYVVDVGVSRPGTLSEPNYRALVDTGATRTAVSPRIVSDLEASPHGPGSYVTADGQTQNTAIYVLDIALFFQATADPDDDTVFRASAPLKVLDIGNLNPKYDVILGMDFLARFHIVLEAELALITPSAAAWHSG